MRARETAVSAVSDPEKNPDKPTSITTASRNRMSDMANLEDRERGSAV
jgi:hypothetical protein